MLECCVARSDIQFGDPRLIAQLQPPQAWKAFEVAKIYQIADFTEGQIPQLRQRLDGPD